MSGEFDDVQEDDLEVLPPEPGEAEAAVGPRSDEVARLTAALEDKTREAREAGEKYLRAAADFDNYRKRMQRDLADFRKYANEQFALELLTVVDHLGLALKHAAESGETVQGLQQGVELVFRQLGEVLEKFGIKRFSAEGDLFDPAKHEAMMQVPTGDVPENTVVQVLQDGYLYHEKILRHAKVGVSKTPERTLPEERTEQEGSEDE